MNFPKLPAAVLSGFFLSVALTTQPLADTPPHQKPATTGATTEPGAARPYGIEKRIPWTTSRIIGSPEAPSPYVVKRVFPDLTFTNPVEVANAPGSDRLFVAELGGKIYSVPNHPDLGTRDLFLDTTNAVKGAEQLFGFAFHPNYEKNHFVYVCYVLKADSPDGSRVSRFMVTQSDPPRLDAHSKIVLTH